MIPKIVHYCWISGDIYPEKIQRCVDSWHRILPDYEIVVWDYKKVHALGVKWCEEAMKAKKYAFVADYVRFYALTNFGGIYLDSDVEVLKSFDDLLSLQYFIGEENHGWGWEAAIIGAEKDVKWMKKCLDYYADRPFINKYGELQTQVLPWIINETVNANFICKDIHAIDEWIDDERVVCRFPVDWFSPMRHDNHELSLTQSTYCIHHFANSWAGKPKVAIKLTLSQRILGMFKKSIRFVKYDILGKKRPS